MDVLSLCPFRASSLTWQPRPGARTLTVVCKATYELRPGESRLAAEQEYPNDDENHWDDDPDRSLYSPSDLVPFKPRADVLLVGHAFAPRYEPARSVVARLAVGGVDKSIEVFGERFWAPDGGLREGQPFVRMPLRYERAAGGPDTENPVGMRCDGRGPLPNLQPLGTTLSRRGDRIAPVGFGPIASRWPQRLAKLGPHADLLRPGAWVDRPLPEDLDASFFNAAPPDQQTDRIAEGASIVLENLSAEHPHLSTRLPGVRPRFIVERAGDALSELSLTADTLWIDTDRSLCTLVWRGRLALRHAQEQGKVHVLLEEPGRVLAWAEVERRCRARPPEVSAPSAKPPAERPPEHETQQISGDQRRRGRRPGEPDPDLPFMKAPRPAPPSPPAAATKPPDKSVELLGDETDPTGRIDLSSAGIANGAPPWLATTAPPIQAPPLPAPLMPAAPIQAPVPPPLISSPPMVPGTGTTLGTAWVLKPPSPPDVSPPAPLGAVISPPALDPPPSSAPAAATTASAPGASPPLEVVDLLWFDATMLERIRGHEVWRGILELLAPKPPEIRYDDEEPPPEEPQEVKDRRDVFGVLTEAEPTGEGALDDVFAGAIGPMGALRPPLALVFGELQLPFDELETLKATVAAVAPLAAGDKKIKEIVDTVNELLKTPWLDGSSGVADGLTARVRDAFAQGGGRLLQTGYLEAHTERRLLEQRRYQRRTVLGRPWIRGLLTLPGAAGPIPTYLPDDLATILPMFHRFKARLIAEVHLQQDQYESHPHALRAVALARVAPSGKGRAKGAAP